MRDNPQVYGPSPPTSRQQLNCQTPINSPTTTHSPPPPPTLHPLPHPAPHLIISGLTMITTLTVLSTVPSAFSAIHLYSPPMSLLAGLKLSVPSLGSTLSPSTVVASALSRFTHERVGTGLPAVLQGMLPASFSVTSNVAPSAGSRISGLEYTCEHQVRSDIRSGQKCQNAADQEDTGQGRALGHGRSRHTDAGTETNRG